MGAWLVSNQLEGVQIPASTFGALMAQWYSATLVRWKLWFESR